MRDLLDEFSYREKVMARKDYSEVKKTRPYTAPIAKVVKRCRRCHETKCQQGGTHKNRVFICKECNDKRAGGMT